LGFRLARLRAREFEIQQEGDRVIVTVNGDLPPSDLASRVDIAQLALTKLSQPGWLGPREIISEGPSDVDWPPRISVDARIPLGWSFDVSLQFETEDGVKSEWYGPFVNPDRQTVAGAPRCPYISLKIWMRLEQPTRTPMIVRGVICEAEGGRLYYPASIIPCFTLRAHIQGGCLIPSA
jgi:hypothetical protein